MAKIIRLGEEFKPEYKEKLICTGADIDLIVDNYYFKDPTTGNLVIAEKKASLDKFKGDPNAQLYGISDGSQIILTNVKKDGTTLYNREKKTKYLKLKKVYRLEAKLTGIEEKLREEEEEKKKREQQQA